MQRRVPPKLEPRSVALRQVLKDPINNWRRAPKPLRQDKSFVLTIIQQASVLPPKSDLERTFPQSLRFDRDIVLALCGREDFEEIYHDRHLFVPDCLTNDKEVMMAYCSKIPRQLQECSEELIDDPDVVLTAVRRCGLELQYASLRLQQDEDMLRIACKLDGRALDFCPLGPTRDKLLLDKEFLMMVLRHNGARMFRLVQDPALRQDRELLLTAVQHGLELRYAPRQFQKDPAFVVAAVAQQAAVYMEISPDLQKDASIAQAAVVSPTSDAAIIIKACEMAPLMQRHQPVAAAIADRGGVQFVREYLHHYPHYLGDKRIMLRAVERINDLYTQCAPHLRDDVDIVLAALGEMSAREVLRSVSPAFLTAHPEVAVKAIAVAHRRCLRLLQPHIPAALWQQRELQKAWIRRGCDVLPQFEAVVRTDREMALLVAEFSHSQFIKVGEPFKNNREFMAEAVSLDGRVLKFAHPSLRSDMELAVRAVANHPDALAGPLIRITKVNLKKHCKDKMQIHDVFVQDVLRGIAVGGAGCSLPKLDRGFETGTALKKRLAAFLGVPFGDLLKAYRKAFENLNTTPQPLTQEQRRAEIGADDAPMRGALWGMIGANDNNNNQGGGGGGLGAAAFDDFFDDDEDDMMHFRNRRIRHVARMQARIGRRAVPAGGGAAAAAAGAGAANNNNDDARNPFLPPPGRFAPPDPLGPAGRNGGAAQADVDRQMMAADRQMMMMAGRRRRPDMDMEFAFMHPPALRQPQRPRFMAPNMDGPPPLVARRARGFGLAGPNNGADAANPPGVAAAAARVDRNDDAQPNVAAAAAARVGRNDDAQPNVAAPAAARVDRFYDAQPNVAAAAAARVGRNDDAQPNVAAAAANRNQAAPGRFGGMYGWIFGRDPELDEARQGLPPGMEEARPPRHVDNWFDDLFDESDEEDEDMMMDIRI